MCRWAAYIGPAIYMEEVVSRPGASLIHQSLHARQCATGTNGDGFGVAWYGEREEPGLYRDILPAWSDCNLRSIARVVRSHLFLAHVRASTGTATSRNNCHPFVVGRWSFMHNGQIGGFERLRQRCDMMIAEHLYDHRKGATDSEALFLLALTEGLDDDPKGAMERAAGRMEALSRDRGGLPHLRLTCAFSNGTQLFAIRYASDDKAPTLYHRLSSRFGGRAVVSEPLEPDQPGWTAVDQGSFLTFEASEAWEEPFRPVSPERIAAE